MEIKVNSEADIIILQPKGRIDWATISIFSAAFRKAIESGVQKMLIDFSETDYIGSAGVRAMIDIHREIETIQGKLVLCSLNDNMKELFRVVQFDKVFKIYEQNIEAINALR